MGETRVTIQEAARTLGVSEGAIRKRVKRGTLAHDKDPDGRVYVYLDDGLDEGIDEVSHPERDALISEMVEELRDEVRYLREQLHQELERRSAEAERYQQIVAALARANASLTEHLQALEPPQEETPPEPPPRSSETAMESGESAEQPSPAAGGAMAEPVQQQRRYSRWASVAIAVLLVGIIAIIVVGWLAGLFRFF
jgi:uncharacterized membrane protein